MHDILTYNYADKKQIFHSVKHVDPKTQTVLRALSGVIIDSLEKLSEPNGYGQVSLPPFSGLDHLAAWSTAIDFNIARGYIRRYPRNPDWNGLQPGEKVRLRRAVATQDAVAVAEEVGKLWRSILALAPYCHGLPFGFAVRMLETCALHPGLHAPNPSSGIFLNRLYEELDDIEYWTARSLRVAIPRTLAIRIDTSAKTFVSVLRCDDAISVDPGVTDFRLDFLR